MNDDTQMLDANHSAPPESLLIGRSNQRSSLDYIVTLSGTLQESRRRVELRYVPDKLLLDGTSFSAFLAFLEGTGSSTPEAVALSVLDEINNEIVPRWIQIAVASDNVGSDLAETVIVEDHQPNWENPGILDRLPRL